jgi:acetyl esterase/lipase
MGGSVFTSMHCDRKPAAHIAKAARIRSLVINYRRSPEHKFPAQIEDVEKAFDWLLGQGYRPENIASVGHSIGGNLAVSLAVRLRDRGATLPGAILSISPWCDLTLSSNSIEANADVDMVLTRGLLELFRSCWLDGTGVHWTDPRVNLLKADLTSCSRMRRCNSRCGRKRLATINNSSRLRTVSTRSSWAPAAFPRSMTPSRKWGSGCVGSFY